MRILSQSRCLLLAALVCLVGWSLTAQAQPQAPKPPTKPTLESFDQATIDAFLKWQKEGKIPLPEGVKREPPEGKPAEVKPTIILPAESKTDTPKSDKDTYHFEMRQKPWREVLEWLADRTQLAFIGVHIPTGTFTFIPTKGKQFTVPQIIDVINEGLLTTDNTQKYILIRREHSFTLVPASEAIDPAIVPHISLRDLEKKGRTEVVRIIVQLKTMEAEITAREFKETMSKFGSATALTQSNQLVLQDTAGSLQEIVRRIKDIEEGEAGQVQTFTHKCEYVSAKAAEQTLKNLLGDAMAEDAALARRSPFGPGGNIQFPQGFPSPFQIQGGRGPGGPSRDSGQQRRKMHYITSDEASNKVYVAGPPDKIALARTFIKEIDSPQAGGVKIEIIPVAGDVTALIGTVTKFMGGGDPKAGGPILDADVTQNAIMIKGTLQQIAEVKQILNVLAGGAGGVGNMRVHQFPQGGTIPVAEELERMLRLLLDNPVRTIKPEGERPAPPPSEGKEREEEEEEELEAAPEEADDDVTGRVLLAGQAPGTTPQEKKDAQPGKKPAAPITIMAVGDRLIIRSDDPDALRAAQEILRLLTTSTGKGDFEVIRLENANASEAVKLLDEMYNGVRPQQQQQQNPFEAMMRARTGGGPAQPAAEPRIRVVADPGTNSLLIRANPVDMLAIRRHIRNTIDNADTGDVKAIIRQWVLPPLKHANAIEVASVVYNVYREFMSPEASRLGGGLGTLGLSGRGPSFGRSTQRDSQGNQRTTQLSIGVDERSNLLVLSCSQNMYNDVKVLVDQLDDAARDSTKTVKVVPIVGLDPALVQQAIDAVQGRTTSATSSPFGSGFGGSSRFGGSSMSPFGSGGMSPFGGGTSPFSGGMSPFGNSIRFGTPGGGSGIMPLGQPGGGFRSPGSFGPGGDRFRGGPGGGGGPRPSIEPGGDSQTRGPDFFEYRVTDDPQVPRFYDPQQQSVVHLNWSFVPTNGIHPVQLASFQQPAQPGGADVRGPRQPVSAQALPDLGVIVISGNNPGDVEEILKVIAELQKLAKGSQVIVRMFPLEQADATSVANTLLTYFQRLTPTASGLIPARQPGVTPMVFGQQGAQALPQAAGSLAMIPLPRYNTILVAAPEARMKDIEQEIKRLDIPIKPQHMARSFPLKRASAPRVADLLSQFYAQRWGTEALTQNQIRITSDVNTNTVIVQAGEADMAEIKSLIERIDEAVSSAVNELRIVPLRAATADELATLLATALAQGTVMPSTGTAAFVQRTGTGLGAGGFPGAQQPGGAFPGATGLGAAGQSAANAALGLTNIAQKATALRFISRQDKKEVLAGQLEDIRLIADVRTNSLIVSAPKDTLDLIISLIRELDVLPYARAEINIFPLRNSDATAVGQMLQQLFLGTGTTGTTGAFQGTQVRPQLTLGGTTPEGTPIIDLRLAVDTRTNSIIAAGSRGDLIVIEAIISRLEDSDVQGRKTEIYHLRNSAAADVANTLNTYISNTISLLQGANQLNVFQQLERNVIIVPEPISNKLLISATPRYYDELVRLIMEIDAQPPQVVIQVMVAEVILTGTDEFGVELGLQSPVLFARSILPGLTVNSTTSPNALPGFNFNNTGPLGGVSGGNAFLNPGIVGFQGVGNLGVGRASPTAGIGGFVFSAASESFSLLLRALKQQGRVEILSRPQVTTTDNQTAQVNVGQDFPVVLGQTITGTGLATNNIEYRLVGVILTVTPRISPDGSVLMRVRPEVSSVIPTQVPISTNLTATAFNVQAVETTVIANDGETVAIGGLITKRDEKRENKIPWLGDLKYIGSAFRYRTHVKEKRELVVILTPHIVRNQFDRARVLAMESKRIDWVLGDVLNFHGTSGMEPVLPQPPSMLPSYSPHGGLGPNGSCPPGMMMPSAPGHPYYQPVPGMPVPGQPMIPTTPGVAPPSLPMPSPGPAPSAPYPYPAPQAQGAPQALIRDVTSTPVMSPAAYPYPTASMPPGGSVPAAPLVYPSPAQGAQLAAMPPSSFVFPTPAEPRKETRGWNLFQRNK